MVRPIRWGILGTGKIACQLTATLNTMPDARVVAVGSRSADTASAFADKFHIPHRHASYAALAQDEEVDIVYVATPHTEHAANTLLCLAAGKPVLCEKPFTINAREAETVIRAARERGLFLMEAMCTRFIPVVREAVRLIAEGAIGDVKMVQGDFGFRTDFSTEHRLLNPKLGGGALLDVGIYPVSIASFFLGPIVDVAAVAVLSDTGVDRQTAVSLRHQNGGVAMAYTSIGVNTPLETIVMGTRGRIHLHAPAYNGKSMTLVSDDGASRTIDVPYEGTGYEFELAHAMQCLREGRTESDLMPLDETLSIMHAMDRIREQIGLRYPGE